jgi:hypothetical protein
MSDASASGADMVELQIQRLESFVGLNKQT